MRIFQLAPINPEKDEQDWLSSTTKEIIIVRAESEERARRIVAFATLQFTPAVYHRTPNASPWLDSKFSNCDHYSGNQFKAEGIEEILSPVDLKKDWEDRKKS